MERLPQPRSPRRDLLELCAGYALILLVLWTPMPWQRPLYWITAAFLIAASLRPGETWRGLGLSGRNLLRSSFILAIALAVAGIAIELAARRGTLHLPHSPQRFFARYWGYSIFSFAQQFLLQGFFLLRLRRLLPHRTALAVALAAAIFALAHLPSPILTVCTLVWGLAACAVFVRYRNLYPLWLAHAVLGICVAICLPGYVTHNMRVGLGYLKYQPLHTPHRSHIDHTVSTRV